MLRQQLGRGPAAVLRGAQIEAPRPRRALWRHDLAALVALALLFALLVPSAQAQKHPEDELDRIFCNSTGTCEPCSQDLSQNHACAVTGYRQPMKCFMQSSSDSWPPHEYSRPSHENDFTKRGEHKEFAMHAPCSVPSSRHMGLFQFELIMAGTLATALGVMSWRKRVLMRM